MQQSIQRDALLSAIRVRLAESPVVALLGARQVGKTTLTERITALPLREIQAIELKQTT